MSADGNGIRLRQPVIATRDLDGTASALERRLGLSVSHRVEDAPSHAEFGIRAALFPVGEQFIELVEPRRDDVPVARHLRRLHGDGGYMVILEVSCLEEAKRRAQECGAQIIWEGGEAVRAVHIHPRATGGTLLSLAQDMRDGRWEQGGINWRAHVRTGVTTGIACAHIACDDPAKACETWSAILGIARSGPEAHTLDLAEGRLLFVPTVTLPHGPSGLDLFTAPGIAPGPALSVGGLDIALVP